MVEIYVLSKHGRIIGELLIPYHKLDLTRKRVSSPLKMK